MHLTILTTILLTLSPSALALALAAPAPEPASIGQPAPASDNATADAEAGHGWCSFHGTLTKLCENDWNLNLRSFRDGAGNAIPDVDNPGDLPGIDHLRYRINNIYGHTMELQLDPDKDEIVFDYRGQHWTDKGEDVPGKCLRGEWTNTKCKHAWDMNTRDFDCGMFC